jgi:ATP-binding cassette, subfamily B, bacterial
MRQRRDTWWLEAVRPRLEILRYAPVAGARLVSVLVTVNVLLGLLPVLFVVATSVLIGRVPPAVTGGVGSPAWDRLVVAFVAAAAAFVAQQLLAPVQSSLGELVKRRVDGDVHERLIALSLRSTGIGPLEDQQALDALKEASRTLENAWRTPGMATAGMLALLARYVQLVGFAALVGIVSSWWVGVGVLAATMVFRYGNRGGLRKFSQVWRDITALSRRTDYLRDTAVQAGAAKELRVFGLTGWLSGRFRESYVEALMPVWRARRRIYLWPYFGYTAVGVTVAGAVLAALGRAGARGTISLTDLALGAQATIAALLLGAYYEECDDHTQFGMLAVRGLEEFAARVDSFDERIAVPSVPADPAGAPRSEIRFARVSFSYPGSERLVLDGLDLELPAGVCTAIVGLNGAGKTTLVKLLGRLHEPTAGAILVDGTDLRSFPVTAWRRQIGVIFQDFTRYELSAADNIAFGAVDRPADPAAVARAAAKAGILTALEALPMGLQTPLSRQYDDGTDLSGGQWQRIAIARALYALDAGARLLVLDEPTAALDVRAEAEFFDRFVELTRGVTTLLISHRFSSVRHADRIVVLQEGRVVEQGTHDGLLAAGGRYAELFTLQAERFATGAA